MKIDRADVLEATRFQRLAADPRATRLASANAGSGKTKVLVERVSRLLLDGADPDKILCLTYTKAAASEMQSRLFQTLGDWSVIGEAELNQALDKLLGQSQARDAKKLGEARQLFARALETPDGLKVQTIHAFCERILSRFPIEAGILPGFEAMDDADVKALRAQTEAAIYKAAWEAPDSDLAAAITHLAAQKADKSLDSLFRWMAGNGEAIKRWAEAGGVESFAQTLDLSADAAVCEQYEQAWEPDVKVEIKEAALALAQSGNANDGKKAQVILSALTNPNPVDAFEAYALILLTQDGAIRKGAVTKGAPAPAPQFFGARNQETPQEALRVFKISQNILAAKALENTRAVFTIAQAYNGHYAAAKQARRWLDFNDQISLARGLLLNAGVADWVLYKLDGGIAHILVDEAQDTAPDQWDIVGALRDGFDAPDPAWPKDKTKTFFAVGDEKQSIYSFQGARPEVFIEKIRSYIGDDLENAITMAMSFRSSPDILKVVDAVFVEQKGIERMFDLDPLLAGPFQCGHTAFREDRGLVELWPITPPPSDPPREVPWDMQPVDAPDQSSARERLAVKISAQIKDWIDTGEPVFDRDLKNPDGSIGGTRPMHAGDVLILVRRRNDFFDAVIRNLKSIGVPVAGADRLVLKEAVAVKDLLSLTRFVLLPFDDLSLAEVLRSPLFNLTEQDVFSLASGREKISLWEAVQAQRPDTAQALTDIRGFARAHAPYEFYARVLDMMDGAGASRLRQIYARLGIEAKDALEAFLARALAHQRRGAPSLQHFLQSFEEDDQDIKREMDAGSGEVRVMTVHGAKGLEAPVVFLPDTTQIPTSRSGSGMIKIDDGYGYLPSSKTSPEVLRPYRDMIAAREKEEYLRLLYVAMTRAESRLIICGFHSGAKEGKGYSDGCWHAEVTAAMRALEGCQIDMYGDGERLVYGTRAKTPLGGAQAEPLHMAELPDWVKRAAPPENTSARRVTPSHLLAPPPTYEAAVRSPSGQGFDRFRRGNLIHKLLEILPGTALGEREDMARAYLAAHHDISGALRGEVFDEVFAVLNHPDFAAIFAPGSRAEVSLAGRGGKLPEGLFLNAQIDRLAVTEDEVFIVDYKSNRPPPTQQDDVPDIYWGQMAAYRELVRDIYPCKRVICGLLWTDGPFLMLLDENRLDAALTLIPAIPN